MTRPALSLLVAACATPGAADADTAGGADTRPAQIEGHTLEACEGGPVYMVVAGQTKDRERMMAYGKAIADSGLYDRLGGYYINAPQPIATFEGEPGAGFVTLIVRFPCAANAKAFWYSKEYQEKIKPLRENPSAGDYTVTLYREADLPPYMEGRVGNAEYTASFDGGTNADARADETAGGYAVPHGLVLGRDADTAPAEDIGGGWPTEAVAVLRRDERTGEAFRLSFSEARRLSIAPVAMETEIYVERGALRLPDRELGAGDYMRLTAGTKPGIIAVGAGTRLLLFRSPGGGFEDPGVTIVGGADRPWQQGLVAEEAGADAGLEIKHLRGDTQSGPRTFLVRIGAGMSVPWEVHSTAEEGYLLEGDYRLAECLPTGRQSYNYDSGGYFYRPAGLIHSGPNSTTRGGATWLIRTPRTLDAIFYPACPSPMRKGAQ